MQKKFKKGQELELSIDRLVYGGRGLGQVDGLKIFVPRTAPGDHVKAQLQKLRSSYGEAKMTELLTPSPKRITPRCRHADICGGCTWQFLPYEEQLKIKESEIRDTLEKIGGLSPDLVKPIIPCEDPWFYRNKMELSFAEGPEGEVMLGFHPPGYHYEVFNLTECFLESPELAEIVVKVRHFANEHRIPVYNSKTHEGVLRNLIIREGKNTGERMVILVTSTSLFAQVDEFIRLFDNGPQVTSLFWNTVYQVPGHPTWTEENCLMGKETLTEALILDQGDRLEFEIHPQAFFQTNTHQAGRLYSDVLRAADLQGHEKVLDLYCGTGSIGLFCALHAREVVGVELNESALENARNNASRNGISNISFYAGSVESRLESLLSGDPPDVVIVDPPRAGLTPVVLEQCLALKAKKLIYVSCNPATQARDLKELVSKGYVLEEVQPVDMFPQTYHVEAVASLRWVC